MAPPARPASAPRPHPPTRIRAHSMTVREQLREPPAMRRDPHPHRSRRSVTQPVRDDRRREPRAPRLAQFSPATRDPLRLLARQPVHDPEPMRTLYPVPPEVLSTPIAPRAPASADRVAAPGVRARRRPVDRVGLILLARSRRGEASRRHRQPPAPEQLAQRLRARHPRRDRLPIVVTRLAAILSRPPPKGRERSSLRPPHHFDAGNARCPSGSTIREKNSCASSADTLPDRSPSIVSIISSAIRRSADCPK